MARKLRNAKPTVARHADSTPPRTRPELPGACLTPNRRMGLDALAAFGLALLARLLYVAWARHHDPYFSWVRPGWDMEHFQAMADMCLKGDWLLSERGIFYYSPLFGWFCGIVYSVFGARNFLAVHLAQAVMGACSIGLAFIIARTWLGRAGAWFAAMTLALAAPWLFYEQTLLHEGMMLFLYTVFLWGARTGALGWRLKWARLVVAGGALGLAALGRGNALACLVVVAGWLLLQGNPESRALSPAEKKTGIRRLGWAPAGALVLGTLLVLGSLVARNHAVAGRWTVGMGNGKVLFYLGNAIDADGTFAYSPRFLDAHEKDPKHDYMGHFFEDLKADPNHFIELLARKTFYFFRTQDLADNMNLQLAEKLLLPVKVTPVKWWWLTPLGLAGLLLAAPRWRDWMLVWLFTAAFAASLILIIPIGRYRAPVLLPLAIGAGFAVQWAAAWWKVGNKERVIGAAAGTVLLGLALAPWPSEHPMIRSNDYGGAVLACLDSGMPKRAVEVCNWALADFPPDSPDYMVILNRRIMALVAAGEEKSPEALESAHKLLQERQFSLEGAIAAVKVYAAHGRVEQARGLAAALLEAPKLPEKDRKELERYIQ
ncbi:MAG: glycosyltransferase family 39 protein [Candidatus Sumerlaeia bacterium]